ncbi:signal peptidase type I, putative [Leishmania tarentolae]|uniref:Signal peptidase complex catalytic subunit SEC11 n=1 Tax=Leishmania tarentolae TaxID=5689 RepID=A0A640K9E0_LEITA|nr:signal peptidase type I, putative [Leishmania tarentolae]
MLFSSYERGLLCVCMCSPVDGTICVTMASPPPPLGRAVHLSLPFVLPPSPFSALIIAISDCIAPDFFYFYCSCHLHKRCCTHACLRLSVSAGCSPPPPPSLSSLPLSSPLRLPHRVLTTTCTMREHIDTLLSMRVRDVVQQVVGTSLLLSVVLVSWRCVAMITKCESSIVVVLSGSMEPGYYRGDVLLLHHRRVHPVQVGDIIVYTLPGEHVPIVHRVHRIHERAGDHKRLYLTKGDNNVHDDRFLFHGGREWLEEGLIIGKAYAYVPRVGYLTIMLSEFKAIKYVALALVGFFALTSTQEI